MSCTACKALSGAHGPLCGDSTLPCSERSILQRGLAGGVLAVPDVVTYVIDGIRPFVLRPYYRVTPGGPSLEAWLEWVRSFERVGAETSSGVWELHLTVGSGSMFVATLETVRDGVVYSYTLAGYTYSTRSQSDEEALYALRQVELLIANRDQPNQSEAN